MIQGRHVAVIEGKFAADFFDTNQRIECIHRGSLSGALCSTETVVATAIECAHFPTEGAKIRMEGRMAGRVVGPDLRFQPDDQPLCSLQIEFTGDGPAL